MQAWLKCGPYADGLTFLWQVDRWMQILLCWEYCSNSCSDHYVAERRAVLGKRHKEKIWAESQKMLLMEKKVTVFHAEGVAGAGPGGLKENSWNAVWSDSRPRLQQWWKMDLEGELTHSMTVTLDFMWWFPGFANNLFFFFFCRAMGPFL